MCNVQLNVNTDTMNLRIWLEKNRVLKCVHTNTAADVIVLRSDLMHTKCKYATDSHLWIIQLFGKIKIE